MRCDGKIKLAFESLENRRLLALNAPVPILPDYAFSTGFSKPDWIASSKTEHYWRDKGKDVIWKTDGTAAGTKAISLDGLYPSPHVVVTSDSIIVAAADSSYDAYPSSSSNSYGEFSSSPFVLPYGVEPVPPFLPPDRWALLAIDAEGVVEELARIQHEPKVAHGHFFYPETVIRNNSESQDLWMFDTNNRAESVVAENVDDDGLKVAINDNYFFSRGNRFYGTDQQVNWQADYIRHVREHPTDQPGAYYLEASGNPGLYFSDGSQSGPIRLVELDPLNGYSFGRYQDTNENAVLSVYSSGTEKIWLSDGTVNGTQRLQVDSPEPRVLHFKSDVYVYGGETLLHIDLATLHVTDVSGFNANDYQFINVERGRLLAVSFFSSDDGVEHARRELFDANGKVSSEVVPSDEYQTPNLATVPHVPYQYSVTDDGVLFFANDGKSGVELWKSAESPEAAHILIDLHPNPNTNAVWEVADETLVVAYGENWQEPKKAEVRGGSVVGFLDENRIDLDGSIVTIEDDSVFDGQIQRLIDDQLTLISHQRVNDRLLMVVARPNNRRELWSTNGTTTGTFQILDSVQNIYHIHRRQSGILSSVLEPFHQFRRNA